MDDYGKCELDLEAAGKSLTGFDFKAIRREFGDDFPNLGMVAGYAVMWVMLKRAGHPLSSKEVLDLQLGDVEQYFGAPDPLTDSELDDEAEQEARFLHSDGFHA